MLPFRNRILLLAATLFAVVGGLGVYDSVAQDPARPQPPRTAPPTREASLDDYFATCLILENQNEIALANLAETRSENAKVKEFARNAQRDHQQWNIELQRFAGREIPNRPGTRPAAAAGTDSRAAPRREPTAGERRVEPTNEPRTAEGRPVAANNPPAIAAAGDRAPRLLQIKQEIADECLANAQKELASKDGREFDSCFIGMQLAMHMYTVDSLKVLERHASAELRPVLHKGRETAQRHLDEAKQIMKELDGKRQTAAAPSPPEKK
jgi:predicted outer membrane protein